MSDSKPEEPTVPEGPDAPELEIREILDENDPLAEQALQLIVASFEAHERQPLAELRAEIMEKRLGLLDPFDFHLIVAIENGRVAGTAAGVYLAGVNAGFITYLAVDPQARGTGVGTSVRAALRAAFELDARRAGQEDLAWLLGEVRLGSAWLETLVRDSGAIVFDLRYYHPGMRLDRDAEPYALYREPVGDRRLTLPAAEVYRILYAVWRRGYRVRYPMQRETFRAMIEELETKPDVRAQ